LSILPGLGRASTTAGASATGGKTRISALVSISCGPTSLHFVAAPCVGVPTASRGHFPAGWRLGTPAATTAERDNDITDGRVAADLASAELRRITPATASAHSNAIPARSKTLVLSKDHSATTTPSRWTEPVSPTPTPAPHDEVVHAHAAPASAPRASQALQARRGDEAGRADQSRRAAHQ